jgi:gliding motility-associated protein GldL
MEPLHEELDWTRVFPELGVEENNDENRLLPLLKKGGMGGGGAADHLAKELDKAGIDQALLSKLKDGMSNLADNAKSLGAISTAAGATDSYVKSLESASEGLSKLTEQYAASATAIAGIAGDVQGNNFGTEMQKLGQNLGALNNVYELQLKSSQDYLESMNQMTSLQDNIKGIMADLAASAQDTASYRENMAMLSQNLTDLNNVYGNMLRAMRG